MVLPFQDPHDRSYRAPIPCRRRRTEQFVDLTKIADRLHVTTVHSQDESVFGRDNSQEPLLTWRKCDGKGSPDAAGFRQDAHRSDNIRAWRLSSKRILHLQADEIAAVAEHNFRFEWQLPEQFGTELCSRSRLTNDKRACGTHIHDIIVAEFSCEDAGAKRPVSANIDISEEDHESHTGIMEGSGAPRHQVLDRVRVDETNRLPALATDPFPFETVRSLLAIV